MMDVPISDKTLFLKYALPCGSVLVERGRVSQAELDRLRETLARGKPVRKDPRKIFRAASQMCAITAARMGKKSIDRAVIRRYFWKEHNGFVEWRASIYRDFNPEECRIKSAKILKAGKKIIVDTPTGRKEITDSFCPVKNGDWVIIHYSTIIETVTEKQAKPLWK